LQQYFSYIVAVIFNGGGNRSTRSEENHRPVASLSGVRTHNISGDRH